MLEGIERFYQIIADSIQEAIPEEWTTAKMEVVFFSDGSDYTGEYTRAEDGVARDFETTFESAQAFRELRKLFENSGQRVWGQACFELNADGKFRMKWGYENCDEKGNTIFDADAELQKEEERRQRLSK